MLKNSREFKSVFDNRKKFFCDTFVVHSSSLKKTDESFLSQEKQATSETICTNLQDSNNAIPAINQSLFDQKLTLNCASSPVDFALQSKTLISSTKLKPLLYCGPRFGLVVTKKNGNAPLRNRIKRRLREAIRHIMSSEFVECRDYVLISKKEVATIPFSVLLKDFKRAMLFLKKTN
jgi:ribonuclease P protein component